MEKEKIYNAVCCKFWDEAMEKLTAECGDYFTVKDYHDIKVGDEILSAYIDGSITVCDNVKEYDEITGRYYWEIEEIQFDGTIDIYGDNDEIIEAFKF